MSTGDLCQLVLATSCPAAMGTISEPLRGGLCRSPRGRPAGRQQVEAVAAAGARDGRWASASLWHLHRAAAASGVDPHCHTHGHWLLTANPSCLITASPGSERVAVPGALTRERSLGRPQPPAGAHHSGFSLASSSMRLLGPGEWGGAHAR